MYLRGISKSTRNIHLKYIMSWLKLHLEALLPVVYFVPLSTLFLVKHFCRKQLQFTQQFIHSLIHLISEPQRCQKTSRRYNYLLTARSGKMNTLSIMPTILKKKKQMSTNVMLLLIWAEVIKEGFFHSNYNCLFSESTL